MSRGEIPANVKAPPVPSINAPTEKDVTGALGKEANGDNVKQMIKTIKEYGRYN